MRSLALLTVLPCGLAGHGFDTALAAIPYCDPYPTPAAPDAPADVMGPDPFPAEVMTLGQTGIAWPDMPALTGPI